MRFLAGLIAALFLVGCSAQPVEAPTMRPTVQPTVQPTTATVAPVEQTNDDRFIKIIRAEYATPMSDAELIALGKDTCSAFEQLGVETFVKMMFVSESSVDPELLGYVMGASALAYCPEYMDDIDSLG